MFFKKTYELVHVEYFNKLIEKFYYGDLTLSKLGYDYFQKTYPKKIEEAILSDTSDATLALTKAESDIKKIEVNNLIKSSLLRFSRDYCKLASIWYLPNINDIYSKFFQSVYNLFDVNITIPKDKIINSKITQGRRKSISNAELLVMIRNANRLLALNYEQYKPRKNSKTSSIINQELTTMFTDQNGNHLHSAKKIGDNFRERTRFRNKKFQLVTKIRCKGINSIVYS